MSFRSLLSSRRIAPLALAVIVISGLPSSAFAHVGSHAAGFADGLAHPFSGLDHVLAMVAVGLWAARLGRPACWLLPATFPIVMALGAWIGANGVPLPWVELGIAGSVIVLGGVIACSLRPSLTASTALIAVFAVFHGHSHGSELASGISALAYGAGFVAATLILHTVGLVLGTWASRPWIFAARGAGAAIAAVGAAFLIMP